MSSGADRVPSEIDLAAQVVHESLHVALRMSADRRVARRVHKSANVTGLLVMINDKIVAIFAAESALPGPLSSRLSGTRLGPQSESLTRGALGGGSPERMLHSDKHRPLHAD